MKATDAPTEHAPSELPHDANAVDVDVDDQLDGTLDDTIDDDDNRVIDDDVIVLPWWNNPVNLVAIALGLILVMGSLGWVLGNNHAQADPNATDVGFLQDMRWHHEQAVKMGLVYIGDPGIDSALEQTAEEIVVGQNIEIGVMIQLLRNFHKPEINETDTAMAWMNEPYPIDQMPGMATESDVARLATLSGAEADELFVRLMVAHHQGGLHMAEYASTHAAESSVRDFARQVIASQTDEIAEMNRLLGRSQQPAA